MFKCISIDIHAHNEYIKLLGGLSNANRKKNELCVPNSSE